MPRRNPTSFMNGVPELLLLALLDGDEMYGYELVAAIRDRTQDAISLGEGVVYPALHTLEAEGCLASRRRSVNGRPRVYYRLTAKGRRRLAKVSDDFSRVAGAVALVLD